MRYIVEESLNNFKFWSGAKDTVEVLTYEDIEKIESYLDIDYGNNEPMTDTEINDYFWFERDNIAELLGYTNWVELEIDHKEEK